MQFLFVEFHGINVWSFTGCLLCVSTDIYILTTFLVIRLASVPADMPLYDILNEFQKGSSHMAAVVKAKGKSKKPLSVVEEQKPEDNSENSQETAPLLMKKDGKSDNVIVDIEKPTLPAVPTSGDTVLNSVPHSSDDIEDAEVIGIITLEDVFKELLQVILWAYGFLTPSHSWL